MDEEIEVIDVEEILDAKREDEKKRIREKYEGEELYACFFQPVQSTDPKLANRKGSKEHYHQCSCLALRSQNIRNGYSNLTNNHLYKSHDLFKLEVQMDAFLANRKKNLAISGPMTKFVNTINDDVKTIHGYMKWIVEANLPFSIVSSPVYKEFSKLNELSVETLQKYMHLVGDLIVDKIKKDIGTGIYGLVFDGWSDGHGSHYVGLFAVFPSATNKCKYLYHHLN
jgi:hypothetical protein